ncbi:MAG: sugar transferase, partial [Clostridia bacterium]|nr:sugar transferase [Clostridia bacterium]
LDELPQLINILRGEMSFVGPRPLIPEEEDIRKLRERYNVYSVLPGMTGLAQINGRDNLTAEEKAEFDRQYVENRTLFLDIKILFKTVFAVLTGKDVVEGAGKDDER